MSAIHSQTFDLFWEPGIGELVMVRPSARHGVKPFDEHPLLVRRVDEVDGIRMFTCETTGPVTYRTTRDGKRLPQHPSWQSFFRAQELLPTECARA